MIVSSYSHDDFVADSLKIRDDIWAETQVEVTLDYAQVMEMIEIIERSTLRMITDQNDLYGIVMGRYEFASPEEETAYARLLIKRYRRKFGNKRRMDSLHGRWAPFAPIEAYESE